MGKKKSANKRKDDYWDDEFEEDMNAAAVEVESEDDEAFAKKAASFSALAVEDDDEDDGLMAMVNRAAKTKVKKNKKKKQVVESEEEEEEEPAPAPASVQADDLDEEEDDWFNDNKKNKKKNKKQQSPPAAAAPAASSPVVEEEPKRILSKKEKERLKKEREKEAKRLANIEKKKKEAEEAAKKGNKQQQKPKDEPAPEPEPKSESKKKAAPAPAPAPAGGKGKKKGPAGIAALRKQLEAQKAAEEEAKRREEEVRKRKEEEEKKRREEERAIKEKEKEKRAKARAKKEQLKAEGKYMTRAQKEAARKAKLRTEQLLASGQIKIAAFDEDNESNDSGSAAEPEKKKRIVYESKKRKGPSKAELEKKKQEEEEQRRREEEERKRKEEEEAAAAKKQQEQEEESSDDDDWEKAADSTDEEEDKTAKQDNVKDDWEDDSEEEEEPKKEEPKKSAPAKKDQDESESEEDSSDDWDEDSDEEDLSPAQLAALKKKEEAAARRQQRQKDALAARSKDDLRSPICCILGHVDTGKTKLLDKIRQTNVQEGEAGGITQQIGATYFPADAIEKKTAVLGKDQVEQMKVPGLLVIDTPGHESFTNLRSRGSSLCNIAILVVDIMHGLEQQTLESIRLLRDRRTPFIVALNKIDRLFEWKATPNNSFKDSLAKQKKSVKQEFETRLEKTILAFAEQGLNAALYYKNPNFAKYVSLVPTSAHTGEGVPDMLNLLVNLTQTRMSDKLMYVTELECTVLEVKVIEGLGTTIDVVLVNGWLHEGDKIVLCGLNGPIVTQVRALLTPQPMRELRIKSQYVHHKSVKAALGIKIAAPDLDKAIAGSRLLVCGPDDDEEDLKEEVMSDLTNLMNSIDRQGKGVWVQASTLGSLEALLEFLRTSNIPVFGINIGPVHRKDVVKASVMLEKAKEFAVMLCFDVKVEKEAEEMAEDLGIKVFKADIIYHLFDRFVEYNKAMLEEKRKEQAGQAVFPCVLKMVPRAIINKKNPIIMGVDVVEGSLRLGTPICVVRPNAEGVREVTVLGKVTSMEQNHKPMEVVKKGHGGGGIAIKIEASSGEQAKTYGRHFDESDEFYSRITRTSIDVLKDSFRKDLSKEEWALVVKLKKILGVD
ncbi:Putative Translation initiation factor 5B [Lichtheimia ramosa]|uniref:Eukaryotic translation initiation factor 5B n=1 Tax=Lichtheimia ramosa TaxID=688394 RepID=A0A077WFL3_9FUNG|nr:Putative Translation initiation factor 5B [Lichtheimia ramosa]